MSQRPPRMTVEVGQVMGNGFVVASLDRPREIDSSGSARYLVTVLCPACGEVVGMRTGELKRVKSCGCVSAMRSKGEPKVIRRAPEPDLPDLSKWQPLVQEASRAFGTDPSYAILIADVANGRTPRMDKRSMH